jgi:hypothetical protein
MDAIMTGAAVASREEGGKSAAFVDECCNQVRLFKLEARYASSNWNRLFFLD